jgi:hypothetical protein
MKKCIKQQLSRYWGGTHITAGAAMGAAIALFSGAPAYAFNPSATEVLSYRISYGPLNAGKATLTYYPTSGTVPYSIEVAVKDSTSLIDFSSRYFMQGRHTPQPFTSATYHARQQENDYRADKLVVFDGNKKQITYTNNRDASDKAPPVKWDGQLRDVFSQLYALRLGGMAPLMRGQELNVMGTKRPFTLLQMAPIKVASAEHKNAPKARPQWRLVLVEREENGSLGKERWIITVREETDKTLTPLRIEAQTKFGTFTAALRN